MMKKKETTESIVYHPRSGLDFRGLCEWPFEFRPVCRVSCPDPETVFRLTQFAEELTKDELDLVRWLTRKDQRSTSVGDVIARRFGGVYRVMPFGFKRLE
jgi:hypothetical protein